MTQRIHESKVEASRATLVPQSPRVTGERRHKELMYLYVRIDERGLLFLTYSFAQGTGL